MNKRDKELKIKNAAKRRFYRYNILRIPPLGESDFIKELFLFQNAMCKLEYPKSEIVESEWETEMYVLVEWLKTIYGNIIDDLSSYLKLDKENLRTKLMNSSEMNNSIKSFIHEKGTIFNIMATMTRYRKLRLKWILMASHVTYNSSLPPRDKEILILRIAWLCGSEYEWDHHTLVGMQVGLSKEEINKIKEGSEAHNWNEFDKTLISAVDELYNNKNLSDGTWNALSERYNTNQLMDLIFVVGAYNMLAMFLNSIGITTEDCVKKSLNEI